VRALNTIHTALRPDGVLLDIHPEPTHAAIEVHLPDHVVLLGPIDQSAQIADIVAARATLQATIDAHQWWRERAVSFEVLYHFESVDEWLQHLADRGSSAVIPPSLIARARELLRSGPGTLRMLRSVYAARLRRTRSEAEG
jgi:hypothetical protein